MSAVPAARLLQIGILAGGPEDIYREWVPRCRRVGIELRYHLTKPNDFKRPLPRDARVMIVLYDMMGHQASGDARAEAKLRGLACVLVPRKWSVAVSRLADAGFVEIMAPPPLSVVPSKGPGLCQHMRAVRTCAACAPVSVSADVLDAQERAQANALSEKEDALLDEMLVQEADLEARLTQAADAERRAVEEKKMENDEVLLCWDDNTGDSRQEQLTRNKAKARIEKLLEAGIDGRTISLWGKLPLKLRTVVEVSL